MCAIIIFFLNLQVFLINYSYEKEARIKYFYFLLHKAEICINVNNDDKNEAFHKFFWLRTFEYKKKNIPIGKVELER